MRHCTKIDIQISCNAIFLKKNKLSLKRLDRGKKQLRIEGSLSPLSTSSECKTQKSTCGGEQAIRDLTKNDENICNINPKF